MKKLWNEFKEFAFKGNVIDMAVGVILGTAITAVVTSLVQDIIMPVLSAIIKIPSDITELTLKINNINIVIYNVSCWINSMYYRINKYK